MTGLVSMLSHLGQARVILFSKMADISDDVQHPKESCIMHRRIDRWTTKKDT